MRFRTCFSLTAKVPSIWEEEIFRLFHPDDLASKHLQELCFFHFVKCQPKKIAERQACKLLCHEYNHLLPSETKRRNDIISKLFGKTGRAFLIEQPFLCDYGSIYHATCTYNTIATDCNTGQHTDVRTYPHVIAYGNRTGIFQAPVSLLYIEGVCGSIKSAVGCKWKWLFIIIVRYMATHYLCKGNRNIWLFMISEKEKCRQGEMYPTIWQASIYKSFVFSILSNASRKRNGPIII